MKRILVIDDEPLVRRLLRRILEAAGYQVSEAENGRRGVELFRENPADLIILDIIMPEQDGLQTMMSLRQEFPDVKVIGISGGDFSSPDGYLQMADMIGAQRTFSKPIERTALLNTIREILDEEPESARVDREAKVPGGEGSFPA
jgi:YesN/AraC family two-component response regulator